jgi:hypothetical protein
MVRRERRLKQTHGHADHPQQPFYLLRNRYNRTSSIYLLHGLANESVWVTLTLCPHLGGSAKPRSYRRPETVGDDGQRIVEQETMIEDQNERYYLDIETQERVKVTYRVHLTMSAIHDGDLEVEAYSDAEAARLALDGWLDADWKCEDMGDKYSIAVFEVYCEDPPEGAVLIQLGSTSEADISGLFEDAPAEKAPGSHTVENSNSGETGGGDPCN